MGAVKDLQARLAAYISHAEWSQCSEFHAGPPFPDCQHDSHVEGRALLAIVNGEPEADWFPGLHLVEPDPEVAAGP